MFSLPHLIEEDMAALDAALTDFIGRSGSQAALITDRGGFLITQKGKLDRLDTTTVGALAANSFAATHALAELIDEASVNSVYQEGEENSALILSIEHYALLVVLFPAALGVGSIKYYTINTLARITLQFHKALDRSPEHGLDLADLNSADVAPIFRRK